MLDETGKFVGTAPTDWKISTVLPGEQPREFEGGASTENFPPGRYRILLRVANPLPKGAPLRFANREQDESRAGWLTLGAVSL